MHGTRQFLLGGLNKFATRNAPITIAKKFDIGVQVAGTVIAHTFGVGERLCYFEVHIDEAVVGSSSTVLFGITGGSQVTAAIAEASLTLGTIHTVEAADDFFAASDNFDITVATADLTAGKVTIYITYWQAVEVADDIPSYTVTA